MRRGSIVVANDRQLAPGAEDAGEAHIANVRQQGEGGFFICLFKPWRFGKRFKVGVYSVIGLEYDLLTLHSSKPWKGGIVVARGNAPGNERSE